MSELVHFCRVNGPEDLYKTIRTYKNNHYLIDINDIEYLDTMSGCRTTILGYNQKSIKYKMSEQLDIMPYYPTVYHSYNEKGVEATKVLNELFPNHTEVFFTPTGSLANETAIKFATKYQLDSGNITKEGICYLSKSYHGTTGLIGCISDQPINTVMNLNLNFPSFQVNLILNENEEINEVETLGNIEYCFASKKPAAIIIDAVTASALYSYSEYFWQELRKISNKYKVLIILDEVVTGFGKLGYMSATDKWNIDPDIITLGKGMTNGYFPLAATLCKPYITEKLNWLLHGMTFSSHPVGAAAMIENVKLLKPKLTEIEQRFVKGIHKTKGLELQKHSLIKSVRITGCLGGLTSYKDINVRKIEEEGWKRGIIVYAGGGPKSTKLTWCLPVTMSNNEIIYFFNILKGIFDDYRTF